MILSLTCKEIIMLEEHQSKMVSLSTRPVIFSEDNTEFQNINEYKKFLVKRMALAVGIRPEDLTTNPVLSGLNVLSNAEFEINNNQEPKA